MTTRIFLESAFVLHTKPYGETSLLVDFLTVNHGKLSILARSARGVRSRFRGILMPFSPLQISCVGKTDLLSLTAVEINGASYFLQNKNLFNGIYLNELVMKLLQRFDPYPNVFHSYHNAIKKLQDSQEEPQKILRIFEKQLLSELGYGLELSKEVTGKTVVPDQFYSYKLGQGIVASGTDKNNFTFRGSHLLAIEKNNFETTEILQDARRLMRFVLSHLLGHHQIKTRELFS